MATATSWLTAAALRPPPKLSLSEWADEHFRLSAESAAEPGRWHTLPYQRGILDAITDPAVERVSVMKSARVGYALALDTPLPTPTGWTTMRDVAAGDYLLAEDGTPCRVVTKSAIHLNRDCYRIRFCDGSEMLADGAHRWAVESDVSLEHLTAARVGRTGRPGPGAIATKAGTIDTATMARAMSRGRTALAVVNAAPLALPDAALPVPPYTLGLWLGDGSSATPRITQHRPDADEVADYVREEGIRTSVRFIDARYPNNATIFFDVPDRGKPISPWAMKLRRLGVLNAKHIPPQYLRGSISQRLALLRGLMDSDGTAGTNGRAEFVNTKEVLARGVYELVVSLGMKATIHWRPAQRAGVLPQWRVNFKPEPALNPFRLRRKALRVIDAAKPTITRRRRIVAVEHVASVPVQCVEVDSPSSLYLAGLQMVPTHNTKCMNAAIAYFMVQDPCPILVVQPTVEDAEGYSKEEIAPMIRDVEVLAGLVSETSVKTSAQTILHKSFPGGVLSMVGANSGRGFRRVSRRVVIFDEVDGYPPSAGNEGDPIKLGERRAEYYWNRKIIAGSTPLVAGSSRIEELFNAGDRRRYYVPCPHCGHMDYLRFSARADADEIDVGHVMRWPKSDPAAAHFICRSCGCVIEETSKRTMIESGEWRAAGEFAGHASFHIWAAYSLSPNATWAQLAAEFLEAKRRPETLKTFVNTTLGEPWKERGEAPDWERLRDRRESYQLGRVPDGPIVLTAGVDVQKDRFVYEVVGWRQNKESWSIDAGALYGDTSLDATWAQLDALLARSFPRVGGGEMPIARLAIDSGYNTQVVYSWARRYAMSRVMATKGVSSARMLVGSPSPVEITVNGKKLKRGYKVWPVGVDIAKGELYGWLGLPRVDGEPPTGYCHFPEYGDDFFMQLTAEHLVTTINRKTNRTRMEWQVQPNRENHYLDCRILARVAAASLGIDRLAPGLPPTPAPTNASTSESDGATDRTSPDATTVKREPFWRADRVRPIPRTGWFAKRR